MGKSISTSDFFERQNKALRSTRWFVVWFALGLLATALAIYFVFRAAATFAELGNLTQEMFPEWHFRTNYAEWIDPALFIFVFAGTLIIVGGASLFKSIEFWNSTGSDVAESLGGREVLPTATSPQERRLINVVQEMSIASGVPVPQIFILKHEKSINAFAAGTSADRAAIAVSRGALEKLSRDELQAVIGHEFSHILNGDMRLNIRLACWIFGLVVISILGEILLRVAVLAPRTRSSDRKSNGGLGMILAAMAVAIIIIGALSQFFSQIIQAAISRSRERLADASSAQFTRNPTALANALSRIGGDAAGSRISSPHSKEFAHLFFADAIGSIFSTHPPLEERIRALNPSWDGKFLPPLSLRENFGKDAKSDEDGMEKNHAHRTMSRRILHLPPLVRELSQNANDARALICILLMTDSPEHNVEQAKILLNRESKAVFKKMESLWQNLKDFPAEKRIESVLIAAPALRSLSVKERAEFCETLDHLARADGRFSIFELCILSSVKSMLIVGDSEQNLSAANVASEIELALNLFLNESGVPAENRASLLASVLAENTLLPKNLRVLENFSPDLSELEAAFQKLRAANILVRENLINAVKKITAADQKETATESDLLSAMSVVLNVPRLRN